MFLLHVAVCLPGVVAKVTVLVIGDHVIVVLFVVVIIVDIEIGDYVLEIKSPVLNQDPKIKNLNNIIYTVGTKLQRIVHSV